MNALHAAAAAWPKKAVEFYRAWLALPAVVLRSPSSILGKCGFPPSAAAVGGVFPFLMVSVGLAAYAKASGNDNLIAGASQGHTATMILFIRHHGRPVTVLRVRHHSWA